MSDSSIALASAMVKNRSEQLIDRGWAAEPSSREVLILVGVCYFIYVGLIALLDSYSLQVKTLWRQSA